MIYKELKIIQKVMVVDHITKKGILRMMPYMQYKNGDFIAQDKP